MKRSRTDLKAQAQRQALNALKRARRTAARTGVDLSDWEDEFLTSVSGRLKTYGRAFGDPEKGAPGQALSLLQAVKLKQIAQKAKGAKPERAERKGRSRFKGRPLPGS